MGCDWEDASMIVDDESFGYAKWVTATSLCFNNTDWVYIASIWKTSIIQLWAKWDQRWFSLMFPQKTWNKKIFGQRL